MDRTDEDRRRSRAAASRRGAAWGLGALAALTGAFASVASADPGSLPGRGAGESFYRALAAPSHGTAGSATAASRGPEPGLLGSASPAPAVRPSSSSEVAGSFRAPRGRSAAAGRTWARSDLGAAPAPARSPGVAFFLSALLPGAGQLYNGNQRGYLFLALDAGAWFARASFLDAGNRKEGDYEAYARRHWDYDRFRSSAGEDGCLWTAEADSLIRTYRSEDPEQFYEELGKSDAYRCGWDDFRSTYDPGDPGALSPRRADYRSQREKANDLKGSADLALGILVLNRLVSAVDAFRVARGRGDGAVPSLRLRGDLEGTPRAPRAVFRLVKELP